MKSILGALSISLGTYLSMAIGHEIISPIVFSVGILLTIYFDLNLVTRETPISIKRALMILPINLIVAFLMGLMTPYIYVLRSTPTFGNSVLGGIVIGLVSLVAREKQKNYKELIIMILMFSFVYLKLPHCVVYSFYGGMYPVVLKHLPKIVVGNLLGGIILGVLNKWRCEDVRSNIREYVCAKKYGIDKASKEAPISGQEVRGIQTFIRRTKE